MDFQEINPNTYEGGIPSGYDLVIAEEGNVEDTALTLYGFDELDDFAGEFKKPVYGFLRL
jgi:hypothetical protein